MKFAIPGEFKDEERWLKYLSTKAFIFEIVAFFIGGINYKILGSFGLSFLGIIVLVVLMLVAFILSSVQIPITWTLKGAGLTLDVIILRLIARSKNKVIYSKNYVS